VAVGVTVGVAVSTAVGVAVGVVVGSVSSDLPHPHAKAKRVSSITTMRIFLSTIYSFSPNHNGNKKRLERRRS
jgi:hypothetical protein